MADFSQAHAPVAVWEGGYANHPNDRGGETLCGIARRCHPGLVLWKLVDAEKDHPSFRQGSAAFTRHLRQIPLTVGRLALYRFFKIIIDLFLVQFPRHGDPSSFLYQHTM